MKPHISICIVFLVMVVIGFGRLVLIDDSRVAHEPLYEEGSLVFSNGYLHGSSVNKGGKGVFPLVVEKSRIDSEKEESMTVEQTAPNDIKYYFDDLSLRLRDFGDFYKNLDDLFVREDRESLWAEKMEAGVRQAFCHMPGTEIAELSCKASICKFSMTVAKTNDYIPRLQRNGLFVPLKSAVGKMRVCLEKCKIFQ